MSSAPGEQATATVLPPPSPRPEGRPGAHDLRSDAEALRARAERLRSGAAALHWTGEEARAFKRRVEQLAQRCVTAADDLDRAAGHLETHQRNG